MLILNGIERTYTTKYIPTHFLASLILNGIESTHHSQTSIAISFMLILNGIESILGICNFQNVSP